MTARSLTSTRTGIKARAASGGAAPVSPACLSTESTRAGRRGFRVAADTSFAAERAAQLDLLGDLVEAHLDTAALEHVVGHGADPDLPVVMSSLAGSTP